MNQVIASEGGSIEGGIELTLVLEIADMENLISSFQKPEKRVSFGSYWTCGQYSDAALPRDVTSHKRMQYDTGHI